MFSPTTDRNAGTLDIRLTAVLTVIAAVVLAVPVEEPTVLRAVAGIPLLLFLPGYAVVTALFPAIAGDASTRSVAIWQPEARAITAVERIVLSMVASVALVGTAAILANAVVGVYLVPILVILVAITVVASLLAYNQRLKLPDRQRAGLLQSLSGPTGPGLPSTATGWFLTLAAVLALVVVGASGAVALGPDGDGVTEFYVGGQTENGTIGMGEQTTMLTAGETATHYVVVKQRRPANANYTVVAEVVNGEGGETITELGRYQMAIDGSGHAVQAVEVSVEGSAADPRVEYYLYEGSAPTEVDAESTLRSLSVDLAVEEST